MNGVKVQTVVSDEFISSFFVFFCAQDVTYPYACTFGSHINFCKDLGGFFSQFANKIAMLSDSNVFEQIFVFSVDSGLVSGH